MVTLHLVQQAHAHGDNAAETVAQAYDLTLADITQRAADGDLDCEHCGRAIAAGDALHTDENTRPQCARCATETHHDR